MGEAVFAITHHTRCTAHKQWTEQMLCTLFYSNRGVPRQCKQGEAIRVPVCLGNAPCHDSRPGRHPSPSSRDNGITASVTAALQRRGPHRSGSPSFAQAVRNPPPGPTASAQLPPPPTATSTHCASPGGPVTPNRGLPANNKGVNTSQFQFWCGTSPGFLRSGQLAMTHGSTSHSLT